MAKLKSPFASLRASGRFTSILTFLRRFHSNIAELTPIPHDTRSLAQLSWRSMYLKAVDLWHALSPLEKQSWESLARPFHMTGFAYFMSLALKPNPGLYLPLVGGIMAGDIDMSSNKITNLPAPGVANQPLIKDTRFSVEQLEWTQNKLALGAGAGSSPTLIDVPAGGAATLVRKTADETVNNSTVLQNDDELLMPMAANEKWLISLYIIMSGHAASDFKVTFTTPVAATGYYCMAGQGHNIYAFAAPRTVNLAGTNTYYFDFTAVVINGVNAGNLQFQWCQNTAVAEDTKVLLNSVLLGHEIT